MIFKKIFRAEDESDEAWKARSEAAYLELLDVLANPHSCLRYTSMYVCPAWLQHPHLIMYTQVVDTKAGVVQTYGVPTFQQVNREPKASVLEVNRILIERYEREGAPWGDFKLATHVWWVRDHARLGFPPVDLLGTEREAELFALAGLPDAS